MASVYDLPTSRVGWRASRDRTSSVRENKGVNVAAGTIKKVVADRGFGFITSDDQKDCFFHRSSLDSSLDFDRLEGGEKVEFEIEQSDKGPRATRIQAAQ